MTPDEKLASAVNRGRYKTLDGREAVVDYIFPAGLLTEGMDAVGWLGVYYLNQLVHYEPCWWDEDGRYTKDGILGREEDHPLDLDLSTWKAPEQIRDKNEQIS